MTEQPIQPAPADRNAGLLSMRTQRRGRVVAVLDGDAHLHVWEPNCRDDPIDCDLTDLVALVLDIGLDAPPAPEPHWTDMGGCTLIVSLDPGARGVITVRGHVVSGEAAVRLAADGFVQILRESIAGVTSEQADEAEDAAQGDDDGIPDSGE